MATPSLISVSVERSGVYHVPDILEDSVNTVNQVLQENHERYHAFFNDRGFHNHITHYMLAALALGASPAQLQRAFEQEEAIQRPLLPLTNTMLLSFRTKRFSEAVWKEIEVKGSHSVVNEYVFSKKPNAELMFTRLFAGVLHPLIHLGYGIEFEQPAIIAEALAQTAIHKNEVAVVMSGTEAASRAMDSYQPISMVHLLHEIRSNDQIRHASCWGDGSWIDDVPLIEAPHELWHIAAKWRISPSELLEKAAEMINVNAFFCGAAQAPPKEHKIDFFLLHNLNCSIFFSAFLNNSWLSTESKVRLLEWKGRFDIISYAARGSPALDIQEIVNYKPKRPGGGWMDLFKRVNNMDDDSHVTKFLRALAHGEKFCQQYEAKGEEILLLRSEMWLQIAHMAIDSTEKEPVPLRRWVRGVGFSTQWKYFHNRL